MFKDISNIALDMDAEVLRDRSLRNYQLYSYRLANPNERGRIELQVQDSSRYFLPHEGYIEVEGRITRALDNTGYGIGDRIGFVNNGIMALFNSAKYIIDGNEIQTISGHLGIATTILGLVHYSDDYQRTLGPSMMFHKDTTDQPENRNVTMNAAGDAIVSMNENYNLGFAARRAMLTDDKEFSCMIPLSHIFGFCIDVKKVIFGAKHAVEFYRKSNDNDALWRAAGVADGKITLSKFALVLPALVPSLEHEQRLMSFMNSNGNTLLSWLNTDD